MLGRMMAALVASLVLVPATPASAGTLTTPNACRWSFDGLWRNLDLDLTGAATPNPVAPGFGTALTGASVHARLPDWVAEYGFNLGLLKEGDNDVPASVWVALAGGGTAEAVQSRQL